MPSGRVIPYAPVLPVPDEPMLLSTVDLNNFDYEHPRTHVREPVWQFVYGSSLYMTLFGVYANFIKSEDPVTGDLLVHEVRLKLVNYQGVLNIGFIDEADPIYRSDLGSLYFGVRAGSQYSLSEIRCPLIATPPAPADPLRVQRGSDNRYPLTFCRMLYPMEPFHFRLGSRRPYENTLQAHIPDIPVFDTEFHARSGVDFYNQPDRAGMYNNNAHDLEYFRNGGMPYGSPRCHEGTANLTA